MTNYNHIRSASQQRSADDYRQYLDALNTSYEQSGLTVGIDELKKLNALTEELEKLPQLDGEMSSAMLAYPNMMTDIFKTQQQFDQALAGHLATVDQGGDVIRTIDDLRVDISSIMLLYSVSTFTGLAYLNEEDPDLAILDAKIQEGLRMLDQEVPEELHEQVRKVKSSYHFVQNKLVGLTRPWAPSAVAFFLMRAESQLQELTRQVQGANEGA
ncbi:hypothetical protein N5O88_09750 [Pseudomonas sp. GD03721]|nr:MULTISPECIES: hypothetical protein [unclassified Pseudomonas]MDH1440453.1 hypothetical protein [Pseudomonas sp. GD03722]WGG03459.1 hypothetical protein N5O88_09750 [Pseudomonas sp. GD03721]WGG07627.1 hypothetical protein N5O87_09760 [Pseudomonas sp. GD03919]